MSEITLYQFAASHFNEKARWALELKRVPHRRVTLMPGPHAPRMKRLTGRTQTPALVDAQNVVAGSAAIVAHLEHRFPDPALEPADSAERDRAWEIAREFDDEVGPAIRLALFFEAMNADFATRTFCADKPYLMRTLYRASFPFVEQFMKRSMGINADNAARGRERTARALDFVAEAGAYTGYLVGHQFSVADLTCAALLMPAVDVGDLGGPTPAGTSAQRAWLERWSAHPGAAWVREIYRRHRRPASPRRSIAD